MQLSGSSYPRVMDNAGNKHATLIHVFEPVFQQSTVAALAGAYVAAPTPAQCFALIAWDDFTLHIVALNNLTLLIT